METEAKIGLAAILCLTSFIVAVFTSGYYDTQASRQCREKLAVAPAQYRSAADIALICK